MPATASITPISALALLDLERSVGPPNDVQRQSDDEILMDRSEQWSSSTLHASTFKTGVVSVDAEFLSRSVGVWTGGRVVGVGCVDSSVYGSKISRSSPSVSLPLEIIATHLFEKKPNSVPAEPAHNPSADPIHASNTPSVYIVTPPPRLSSTMQRLYSLLSRRLREHKQRQKYPRTYDQTRLLATDTATSAKQADERAETEKQAEALLNRVSVLQYLDMPGLIESIAEIRNTTIGMTLSSADPITNQQQEYDANQAIVLLLGLSQTLDSTLSRYGVVRTAALLSSVLSSLRSLSKRTMTKEPNQPSQNLNPFVLVDLDMAYLARNPGPDSSSTRERGGRSSDSGLETAFASMTGSRMRVLPVGVLERMVERAMDVIVAVHDGDGKIDAAERRRIVEVVHDAVGDCLGSWAIWETG